MASVIQQLKTAHKITVIYKILAYLDSTGPKRSWGAGGGRVRDIIGQLIYQLWKKYNKIMKNILKLSNFFWTLFPECEKSASMKAC